MHRAKLSLDQCGHFFNRDTWLSERSLSVAVTAVLAAKTSIGVGSTAKWIFAERHPAALTVRSLWSEHHPTATENESRMWSGREQNLQSSLCSAQSWSRRGFHSAGALRRLS